MCLVGNFKCSTPFSEFFHYICRSHTPRNNTHPCKYSRLHSFHHFSQVFWCWRRSENIPIFLINSTHIGINWGIMTMLLFWSFTKRRKIFSLIVSIFWRKMRHENHKKLSYIHIVAHILEYCKTVFDFSCFFRILPKIIYLRMKLFSFFIVLFFFASCWDTSSKDTEIQVLKEEIQILKQELQNTKNPQEDSQISSLLQENMMQRGTIYASFEELIEAVPDCLSLQHDCNYCGVKDDKPIICSTSICTPGSYTPGWSCSMRMMQ